MKKILFSILFLAFFINSQAQTNLYENPEFDAISKTHKIIAVVPFKTQVKLRPKQMKDMDDKKLHRLEKSEGEGIQTAMYSWFLKRKKRGKLQNLEVQDPKTTTALLKRKNIDYDNITDYTPQELAKILEVDAIITGEFETNKPMSEGASVALGLVLGFWGSTNSAIVNMSVHNAEDGVLLWNYNKKVRGSIGSSPEDLINILMRKASRRLAYTKNN
jgi:Skp family chaperone for outer membrane proteins